MFRCLAALIFVTACTATETDVAPPEYILYYPAGLAVSPSEKSLFVLSANSDLRYSGGTMTVFDLDAVEALTQTSLIHPIDPPAGCAYLGDRKQVMSCPTVDGDGQPTSVMVPHATVQIGNFGVAMGVQELVDTTGATTKLRIFATVRGDPSITWIDFDEQNRSVSCGDIATYARCSQEHRLTRLRSSTDEFAIPPEPFYLAVDGVGENVMTAHLTSGAVTLVDAPRLEGSSPPVIHDVDQSFWGVVGTQGLIGAVGVAARTPGDPGSLYYVTSRYEARVAALTVARGRPSPTGRPWKSLVSTSSFFLNGLTIGGQLNDARDLVFSEDGNRLYLISRTPTSLQVFDTSLDANGAPKNQLIGVLELCEQAATLALADFGLGPRVVVPCFGNGQVWVIDAVSLAIETTEDVGRGPAAVAISPSRKRIYVANYAEDTLSVLDATPQVKTQNRTVLRLGTPRSTEN
jgi:DNA-binding beta-propeller fold protein YncE